MTFSTFLLVYAISFVFCFCLSLYINWYSGRDTYLKDLAFICIISLIPFANTFVAVFCLLLRLETDRQIILKGRRF